MIARPVNRPRPIPFDSPSPSIALAATQPQDAPRPVSWAGSSGPAGQPAPGGPHGLGSPLRHVAEEPALPYLVQRRSPVVVGAAQTGAAPQTAAGTFEPMAPHAPPTPNQALASTEARRRSAGPSPATGPGGGELNARFVGQGALSVRSSVTGRHYRFQGHGDCLRVDKLDLVLLRRIPDLVLS